MSFISRIISESEVLSSIKMRMPDLFVNITVAKLNVVMEVAGINSKLNVTLKLSKLYSGGYPNIKEDSVLFIEILNILHILKHPKEIELLVLLHFSPDNEDVILSLPSEIIDVYSTISFEKTFRETLIALNLPHLLKIAKYEPSVEDLINACRYNNLDLCRLFVKIIMNCDSSIDLSFNKYEIYRSACLSKDLKIVHLIAKLYIKANIVDFINHINYDMIRTACKSGVFEIAKFVWNLELRVDIINKRNKRDEIVFKDYGGEYPELEKEMIKELSTFVNSEIHALGNKKTCLSGFEEDDRIKENEKIALIKSGNHYKIFKTACQYNNFNLAKSAWMASIDNKVPIDLNNTKDEIFRIVCLTDNKQFILWIWEIIIRDDMPCGIIFGNSMYFSTNNLLNTCPLLD